MNFVGLEYPRELVLYVSFFAFWLGASIGSFLNVCIYRLPEGRSVVRPPSACSACGTRLGFLDMVPILSALVLKGRCRYCGARFSMRHAWIEGFTGVFFVLFFLRYGMRFSYLTALLVSSYMLVIGLIDLDHGKILNSTIVFGGCFFGIYFLALVGLGVDNLLGQRVLYGALAFGIAFLLVLLCSKLDFIGMGDVKLLAVMGIIFHKKILFVVTLAVLMAVLYGMAMILLKKKKWNSFIKMGPFFALSAIIFLMIG